jgi:hypothetical protein
VGKLNKLRDRGSLVEGHDKAHDVLDASHLILMAQLPVLVGAHDVPALGVRLGGVDEFFDSLPRLAVELSILTEREVYNN